MSDPRIDWKHAHLAQDLIGDSPLVSCRFHPAGRYVFAGSEGFQIVRWDRQDGSRLTLPDAHESWVPAIGFSADGTAMYSGGCDGTLVWWSDCAGSPSPTRKITAHQGWINAVSLAPDGKLIATAGNDRFVRIWSTLDGTLEAELPGHERPVYRVAFEGDGRHLVSADLLGRVVQWEIATRKECRRLDASKLYKYEGGQGVDYGGVRDLAFSPDRSRLACSGLVEASNPLGAVSIPAVLQLDWLEGKEIVLSRPKESVAGVGWAVRWHASGFLILAAGGTGGGLLWFFEPGQSNESGKFALGNTARDLDLSPDGRYTATAHHDGHVRITGLFAKAPG